MQEYYYSMMVSLAIVALLIVIIYKKRNPNQEYTQPALEHPTKCVDCEHHLTSNNNIYVGQKSKCYACERQAFRSSCGNPLAVFNEHPIRYYSLPPIQGMGFPKAGYMAP